MEEAGKLVEVSHRGLVRLKGVATSVTVFALMPTQLAGRTLPPTLPPGAAYLSCRLSLHMRQPCRGLHCTWHGCGLIDAASRSAEQQAWPRVRVRGLSSRLRAAGKAKLLAGPQGFLCRVQIPATHPGLEGM